MYTIQCVRGVGVWGHRRGEGLRQIKHLPQSPFTGQFFITIFGNTFYQSSLSLLLSIAFPSVSRLLVTLGADILDLLLHSLVCFVYKNFFVYRSLTASLLCIRNLLIWQKSKAKIAITGIFFPSRRYWMELWWRAICSYCAFPPRPSRDLLFPTSVVHM